MKKLFFTMAAIVTAMIISAQVAIDPAYSLQWEMNFVDYAINNLPGATNSSKSYVQTGHQSRQQAVLYHDGY